jgi:hypothetical protein
VTAGLDIPAATVAVAAVVAAALAVHTPLPVRSAVVVVGAVVAVATWHFVEQRTCPPYWHQRPPQKQQAEEVAESCRAMPEDTRALLHRVLLVAVVEVLEWVACWWRSESRFPYRPDSHLPFLEFLAFLATEVFEDIPGWELAVRCCWRW